MGSFSLFQWGIAAVIVLVLYKILSSPGRKSSGTSAGSPPYHCMQCGTDGWGTTRTSGSIAIEIVLWLCFLVPGLIYSVWRLTTRRKVCAACGSESIVPFATPAAQSHRRQLQAPQAAGQSPVA